MSKEQVSTYVPVSMKEQWQALAAQEDTTGAALLRIVMTKVLETNGAPIPPATPTDQGRGTRLTLRLSAQEASALRERAVQQGMTRQRCLIALIRANILDMPTPSTTELAALRATNRLLASIGRNVNQIARAVNTGHGIPASEAIKILRDLLEQEAVLHDLASRLLRLTLHRWTTRHSEDTDGPP